MENATSHDSSKFWIEAAIGFNGSTVDELLTYAKDLAKELPYAKDIKISISTCEGFFQGAGLAAVAAFTYDPNKSATENLARCCGAVLVDGSLIAAAALVTTSAWPAFFAGFVAGAALNYFGLETADVGTYLSDRIGQFLASTGILGEYDDGESNGIPKYVSSYMATCHDRMGTAISTVTNSPIALDLDGNGLNLVSKEDSSAFFDMDMDGFREKVQWVGAGDGFLARDVDGNGVIDDRTELFGDTEGFADGWAKLATLDSNSDGIISADDAAWGSLLVWRDLDGDGFSDEGELATLDEAGVASISLDADAALASTFTRTDSTTGQAQDVWLDQDPMLTTYGGDFTLDPETLFLPWLRGYGQVADLPVALAN